MSPRRIRTPSTAHLISARAAVAALSCSHADVIVYDARNEALVALERVAGAISWKPFNERGREQQECEGKLALVYDAGSDNLDAAHSKAANVVRQILAEYPFNARICLIAGGLPALKAIAPRLIVVAPRNAEEMMKLRKKLNSMKNIPSWANDALEGIINSVKPAASIFNWLYVGSDHDARSLTSMKKSQYTHILTVGAELCINYPADFSYLFIPALDTSSYRIIDHLRKTTVFLRDLRKRFERGENVKVLVHCYAGMSRSVTVVAAFLIAEGMSVDNALRFIATKRIGASPNHGFISQLKEWTHNFEKIEGLDRRSDEHTLFNAPSLQLDLDLPMEERRPSELEREILDDCIDRSRMPIDMSPVTPAQPTEDEEIWADDIEEDDAVETSDIDTPYLDTRYSTTMRKMIGGSNGNTPNSKLTAVLRRELLSADEMSDEEEERK